MSSNRALSGFTMTKYNNWAVEQVRLSQQGEIVKGQRFRLTKHNYDLALHHLQPWLDKQLEIDPDFIFTVKNYEWIHHCYRQGTKRNNGARVSLSRSTSNDFSALTTERKALKTKAKTYQKPKSWGGLARKSENDLNRNKRLLG